MTSLRPLTILVVVSAAVLFSAHQHFLSGVLMGAVMYHTIDTWRKAQ